MNFINNVEMAALVDAGMGETEIIKTTDGDVTTTTIYAGAPYRKAIQEGENFRSEIVWRIRRTIIAEVANSNITTVSTLWAEGAWLNRATLTYNYL